MFIMNKDVFIRLSGCPYNLAVIRWGKQHQNVTTSLQQILKNKKNKKNTHLYETVLKIFKMC